MSELVGQLATKAGRDRSVADKNLGIIVESPGTKGSPDEVQTLIDKIPGAEAAIAASDSSGLARLLGDGLMAVGTELVALGIGIMGIQTVARKLLHFGRDEFGADRKGEIAGTPGLSHFVKINF